MFARIITFGIKPGTADEMRRIMEQKFVPWLRGQKGFHGMHLVQIGDTEVISFETWESKENADAAGPEGERVVQQMLGHILTSTPSFRGGKMIVHAAGHGPHYGVHGVSR